MIGKGNIRIFIKTAYSKREFLKFLLLALILCLQSVNLVAQSGTEILKITLKDYSHFIGEKIEESEDEILLAIKNTKDTITINKRLIKETSLLNKNKSNILEALRDDKYEKIEMYNGSVYKGQTISEDEHNIVFEANNISDTLLLPKDKIIKYINKADYFIYPEDKYHKKEGSVNSIRMLFASNLDNNLLQFEILRSKLTNPNQAFGAGVGLLLGNFDFVEIGFAEIFLYSKSYLSDNQRRLFFEAKVGAAIKLQSDSVYENRNFDAYTSGPQFQYSIGVDFANSIDYKWSIFVGHLMQFTKTVTQTTIQDDILNISDNQIINKPTVGVSFNF